ncbi:MAG: ABC transporter permease [Treponema sp.]|jgi:simple sugar transport system permease protein|nr:ABC transporter permease [Treponema sp.]
MLNTILYDSVYHATPILLCVLGGIFAYKANVLNISLEGTMMMGAFISVLVAMFTGSVILGYLSAFAVCLIIGYIFAYMSVRRNGNVIIIGLAINMMVPAVAGFVLQFMRTPNITLTWINAADFKLHLPLIKDMPLLGSILSGHTPITYFAFFLIFVMMVVMYKTCFGVHVRVVGENEDAAISLGLRTGRYKIAAILTGSLCCALAGINLSLERMALYTNNMTSGRGFIAIAAIYCGRGAPGASAVYAIIFGLARALAVNMGLFAGPAATLFNIIPYIVMVVTLTVVSAVKARKRHNRGI